MVNKINRSIHQHVFRMNWKNGDSGVVIDDDVLISKRALITTKK